MRNPGFLTVFLCESCRFADPDLEELSFHEISSFRDLDNHVNIAPIENTSDAEDTWKSFERRGLHFIHRNINSLLDKIDQLRYFAEKSKPAIIGITESKIDETVSETKFDILGYPPIGNDRTRHSGGCGSLYQRRYRL